MTMTSGAEGSTPFDIWVRQMQDATTSDWQTPGQTAPTVENLVQQLQRLGRAPAGDPASIANYLRSSGWAPTPTPDTEGGFLGKDGLSIASVMAPFVGGMAFGGAAGGAQLPFGENAALAGAPAEAGVGVGGAQLPYGENAVLAGAGGPQMPAATLPTDPSFGGALTQTAAGTWESPAIATGVATGAATGAASGAASAASSTAIKKILDGTAGPEDYAALLGAVAPSVLGYIGAGKQADTLRSIADQSRTDRAPFLAKANEWLANPEAYAAGPGKASLDATLRALSVNGNPFGSPTSIALAGDIANKNWQNAVTGFANVGLSGTDSRNQILTNAAGADANQFNAVGAGIENVFNPKMSLYDTFAKLKQNGLV